MAIPAQKNNQLKKNLKAYIHKRIISVIDLKKADSPKLSVCCEFNLF